MLICSLFNGKAVRIAGIVTGVALIGGFIAIMVGTSKYYETKGKAFDPNLTGLIVSAIVFMAVIAVIYFLGDKRKISDTRSIVYGAVAIALSFAISYIKFFEMPQGGSLTFASLLPLMIYCCMFGTRRGVIACLIYGVLQAVQDPFIIHPMQFLLDYPLAFGMIGVSGIFIEKNVFRFKGKLQKFNNVFGFTCGVIIGVIGRFICHVVSGVFAFHTWADLVTYSTVTAYSMGYNSFAFADMAIDIGAGIMLLLSKAFTSQMAKSGDVGKKVQPAPAQEIEEEDDGFVYLDDLKAKETSTSTTSENSYAQAEDVEE
ncbi:MAG: energy-coupled thiamine transporter ThiT, partial [Clostridia bacterium]|nr:energy-coupled thiamine transporter ThiT [Clostridia bacterium]